MTAFLAHCLTIPAIVVECGRRASFEGRTLISKWSTGGTHTFVSTVQCTVLTMYVLNLIDSLNAFRTGSIEQTNKQKSIVL